MAPIRWPSKEAREIVRLAEAHGLRAGLSARGHIRIFNSEGRVVMHTGSNLSPRNVHNARAQIKRAVRKQKEPNE
jgi:hypothetical protein